MQTHHKLLQLSRTVPIRPRLPQLWVADYASSFRETLLRYAPLTTSHIFFFFFFPSSSSFFSPSMAKYRPNIDGKQRRPNAIPGDTWPRSQGESILMRTRTRRGRISHHYRTHHPLKMLDDSLSPSPFLPLLKRFDGSTIAIVLSGTKEGTISSAFVQRGIDIFPCRRGRKHGILSERRYYERRSVLFLVLPIPVREISRRKTFNVSPWKERKTFQRLIVRDSSLIVDRF